MTAPHGVAGRPQYVPEYREYRFPISVKGVVCQGQKVVLLKNERDEWELPGGKIELTETPESCVAREIREELGLEVNVGPVLDTWLYHIRADRIVFIVTYGCHPEPFSTITHSPEHKAVGEFTREEVRGLRMPDGYKRSIEAWFEALSHGDAR